MSVGDMSCMERRDFGCLSGRLSLSESDFLSRSTFGEGNDSLFHSISKPVGFLRGKTKLAHIFSANLPTRFLLIQPLSDLVALITKPNDDITLDRSQRTDPRSACGICHRADRDGERRACRSMAVISQFTVVEVSLEDEQIGFREVEEEIGCFGMEVPVSESSTPEGMLLVDPNTLPFVFLNKWFQQSRMQKQMRGNIPSTSYRAS